MKIGIFTTHFAINYGAVLQAYALRKSIEKLGYQCVIINYAPTNRVDGRKFVYNFKDIKSSLYSILLFLNLKFKKSKKIKIKKFDSFLNLNCNLTTDTYNSFSELKSNLPYYDCLICGSDQIWNLNLFDEPAFFLRFEDIYPETKYVAYAPSIAEKMTHKQLKEIAKNIQHFTSLSMRENKSAMQLSEYINKPISTVLDPVFLLSKEEWQIVEEPLDIEKPFILTYALVSGSNFSKVLSTVRKELKHKVVNINLNPFDKFLTDYSLTSLSPGNFVWLFRNAEFICTSSFHGTVFSIVFEKQFYTVPASIRGIRIENILTQLSLEHRLITDNESFENKLDFQQIDYSKVSKQLEKHRKESLNYIKKAVSNSHIVQ